MKLLLDTHILLWAAVRSKRLSAKARAMIGNPENDLFFSAVSLWEIAIKHGLGRPDLRIAPARFRGALLRNGYEELPITGIHALAVTSLPPLHKDPFDRILIAQAKSEGIILLTSDPIVAQYPIPLHLV